ncbi:hypothetical protein PUMCH_004877 [Australozyma saopauloensis]|uniref:RNA exonuclease 3 n=1 Tax=Australozyma saopauloensis TaxID=291208 RepID=A0AAX4HFT9_9ASCO|nr:hypothetical protein PUMCH_004877 [[Candida] saopauloensis]
MFKTSDNVFADVKCPNLVKTGNCSVVNCLFKHPVLKRKADDNGNDQKRKRLDSSLADPLPKRAKENLPIEKDVLFIVVKALDNGLVLPKVERIDNTKKISHYFSVKKQSATPNKSAINKEFEIALNSRSLDEYRETVDEFLGVRGNRVPATDLRVIQPIVVNPSPALIPVRRKYIELFVEAIRRHQPNIKVPIWTATEEEYKIASTSTSTTYNVTIKKKIYELNHPEKVAKAKNQAFTKDQYLKELRDLCIDREKLIKFGFIMSQPDSIPEPEQVRICHRCKLEFKLDDAEKEIDCRYHSGKIIKSQLNERLHSCCGGVLGSTDADPCCKSNHHVFYWNGPEEMNHFLPFKDTRKIWGTRKGKLEAVGIDCEMGFTTKGFELLRITAIDFFSGEEVIDVLVRPKGKVLDLNTRWSGIAEIKDEAMSFEDSITLLGEVIDSNTILVGHGLENDMNAMRLIHSKVVDTAVLYPKHKATPTFRFSLKQLAFQYLGRNIQIGEHDSGEDSLAAIDITKHFIEKTLSSQ